MKLAQYVPRPLSLLVNVPKLLDLIQGVQKLKINFINFEAKLIKFIFIYRTPCMRLSNIGTFTEKIKGLVTYCASFTFSTRMVLEIENFKLRIARDKIVKNLKYFENG